MIDVNPHFPYFKSIQQVDDEQSRLRIKRQRRKENESYTIEFTHIIPLFILSQQCLSL